MGTGSVPLKFVKFGRRSSDNRNVVMYGQIRSIEQYSVFYGKLSYMNGLFSRIECDLIK